VANRIQYEGGWTAVPNALLNDPRVSCKSKGLWVYLRSKPSGWVFSSERIASDHADGRDAVRSGLQELEDAGYLRREQARNPDGTIGDMVYTLLDQPSADQPSPENPSPENPSTVYTSSKKENSKTTCSESSDSSQGGGGSVWGAARAFHDAYPDGANDVPTKAILRTIASVLESGVEPSTLTRSAMRYARDVVDNGTEPKYVRSPINFLRDGYWQQYTDEAVEAKREAELATIQTYSNGLRIQT